MSDANDQQKPEKRPDKAPQEIVNKFWKSFRTKKPGKVSSIFPESLHIDTLRPLKEVEASSPRNAAESYEVVARECRERIEQIVRECRRTNEKFTDPDFDIENDKKFKLGNCLRGLVRSGDETTFPKSVHRVDWIFENPQFIVDGFSHTDIKQGSHCGDCWWLAAVATLCDRPDLMNRICVARDEECGVYGFIFYRDGQWVSTVIDDNLYMERSDFDFHKDRYDSTGKRAREHKKRYQTGSDALWFSQCSDPNETWLPLMEKAYAKLHGDYDAISGGWSGDAVEDLTGGVTTTIATNRVLSRDILWTELLNCDGEFVFAVSALGYGATDTKGGLALGHAYSILRATEEIDESGKKVRLVLLRNPWGERDGSGVGEWNGPWGDGSKEWTAYWLKKLGHKFGDDGIFWMTYEDMLSTFIFLHRTRIFDEKWTTVQRWTSVNVPWVTVYLRTKFVVRIEKAGPVVFVLSQLDSRYFLGLEGQYKFELNFILQDANTSPAERIVTVKPIHSWYERSVSAEVTLEPGTYEVVPSITAWRDGAAKRVEDIVKDYVPKNPRKLMQVGASYDMAHAKASFPDEEEEENCEEDTNKEETSEAEIEEHSNQGHGKDEESKEEEQTLGILEGYKVNKQGKVLNEDGEVIGELEEGDISKCAGKKINAKGEVYDAESQILGKVKPISEKDDETSSESDGIDTPNTSDTSSTINGEENDTRGGKDDKEKNDDKDKNDDKEKTDDTNNDSDDDEDGPVPWNAVCVIGLRVYAQDSEVTIKLLKPKDSEETS